jgi:hypothetical protein
MKGELLRIILVCPRVCESETAMDLLMLLLAQAAEDRRAHPVVVTLQRSCAPYRIPADKALRAQLLDAARIRSRRL